MQMKNISILGSTGSVGTQALEVIDRLDDVRVAGLSNTDIHLLEKQIRKYKPPVAAVAKKSALALKISAGRYPDKVVGGAAGLCGCRRAGGRFY